MAVSLGFYPKKGNLQDMKTPYVGTASSVDM